MFEDTDNRPEPAKTKKTQSRILLYILAGLATLLLGIAAVLAYKVLSTSGFKIPSHIANSTNYPIFAPKKLPNGYSIDNGSFTFSEGALLFRAEDLSGSTIVFTEQQKPDDLNFEEFYKLQMQDAKRLQGTPYPSVIGKSPVGDKWLLSVVTSDTWILVSTSALLGEQDFRAIASGLKPY